MAKRSPGDDVEMPLGAEKLETLTGFRLNSVIDQSFLSTMSEVIRLPLGGVQ